MTRYRRLHQERGLDFYSTAECKAFSSPYTAPGDKTEFEDRMGDLVDDNHGLSSPTWELDRPEADQE